jgi:hypothetical protein
MVRSHAMSSAHPEELLDFFGAYFHEDWTLDDETPDLVLERYIRDATPTETARVANAIDAFAAAIADDSKLDEALFKELGCYYLSSADRQSTRAWLEHVCATLRAASRSVLS